MELEERIQRLEEDVSILKNQIRNSLLDIQEQLASNYHPSLRVSRGASRQAARRPRGGEPPADDDDEEDSQPRVRKVSLKELQHEPDDDPRSHADTGQRRGNGRTSPLPGAPGSPVPFGDLGLYAELIKWAHASAARVGAANTRRVLETYAAEGMIQTQTAAAIVDLVPSVGDDPSADEVSADDMLTVLMALHGVLTASGAGPATAEGRRG